MAKTIVFRSKVRKAAGVALEAWETGLRSIQGQVKAEVQSLIDKSYPPASKPFRPPHKRTGRLQKGITVVVEKGTRGRAAALVVKSSVPYGSYLEYGTIKMSPRPYARTVLMAGGRRGDKLKKKWTDQIARAAKQKANRSGRKTSRRSR